MDTYTSAYVGINVANGVVSWPRIQELSTLSSVHVFVLSARGKLLLVESEGSFDVDELDAAARIAHTICLERTDCLQSWMRRTVEEYLKNTTEWRGSA